MAKSAPGSAPGNAAGDAGYPPVAFHFSVNLGPQAAAADTAFQEVSGLDQTMKTEDLVEGGENRFVHRLPTGVRQGTLSLKRGIAGQASPLVKWCREVLENGLALRIRPMPVLIHLLDAQGQPLRTWSLANAYPVRWDIEPFNASRNEVAIEHIELAYQTCTRMP